MMNWELSLESNHRYEALCMAAAAGLHLFLLAWNPIILRSDYKPVHDFVTIETVEQAGSPLLQEKPVKMSLVDTLRDMLTKPKTDQLEHVAPAPIARPVVTPIRAPLLEEKRRAQTPMTFKPRSHDEDLAAMNNPSAIQTPNVKTPNLPPAAPTLKTKAFGGVRAQDLPFKMGGGEESLATGQATSIPIAVGNSSAKSALGYQAPALNDQSKHRVGITPGLTRTPRAEALSSAAPAPITIGTGQPHAAPTSGAAAPALHQQSGGMINRALSQGWRTSSGGSVQALSNSAQQAPQLAQGAGLTDKPLKKKSFELEGPLNNRRIVTKVLPQYPAWAEEQGIAGAVRIAFTVDAAGKVLSNMQVRQTTGYPDLDKLGIDALKQWKFAPLEGADDGSGQWGIITFTFSLAG
jgi:TonB family protein